MGSLLLMGPPGLQDWLSRDAWTVLGERRVIALFLVVAVAVGLVELLATFARRPFRPAR